MSEFDEKLNSLLSNPDSMAQIMKLAQTLSGGTSDGPPPNPEPAPAPAPPPAEPKRMPSPPPFRQTVSAPTPGTQSADPISSLLGGLDPGMIAKLIPLIQELSSDQNSSARQLLYARRPYLKASRQEKVERALQLARIVRIGKKFLAGWGDLHV